MNICASPRERLGGGETKSQPQVAHIEETITRSNSKLALRMSAFEDGFKSQQVKLEDQLSKLGEVQQMMADSLQESNFLRVKVEDTSSKLDQVHQLVADSMQKFSPMLSTLQASDTSEVDLPKWVPAFEAQLMTSMELLLDQCLAKHQRHLPQKVPSPREPLPSEAVPGSFLPPLIAAPTEASSTYPAQASDVLLEEKKQGSIDGSGDLATTPDVNEKLVTNSKQLIRRDNAALISKESQQGGSSKVVPKSSNLLASGPRKPPRVIFGHNMQAAEDENLQILVQSFKFQIVVLTVIVLQCVVLGWEGDKALTLEIERLEGIRTNTDLPGYFQALTYIFAAFFAVELVLRVLAWKSKFWSWTDQEFFAWNCFDLAITLSSVFDFFGIRTGVLRSVRLLRVARLLRMLRVFPKLRKMVYGLLHSMKAFFWLLIMLFLTLYVFTLAFMLGAVTFLKDSSVEEYQAIKDLPREEDSEMWIVVNRFGTLPLTMRSLFASLTGGDPWDWLFAPMMANSWTITIVAIFFVVFFVFAVMNVVTGVFVHEAMKISEIDKDIMITDLTEERKMLEHDMHQLIASLDQNGDGVITVGELRRMLAEDDVQRWLAGCDIDLNLENMDRVLRVLDEQNAGKIQKDVFFSVLSKITGGARSVDIFFLYHELKMETQELRRLVELSRNIEADIEADMI